MPPQAQEGGAKTYGVALLSNAMHLENFARAFAAAPAGCASCAWWTSPARSRTSRGATGRWPAGTVSPTRRRSTRSTTPRSTSWRWTARSSAGRAWPSRAARPGKHLWIDKPPAMTAADLRPVVDAVDCAGVTSLVFCHVAAPWLAALRAALLDGRIGELHALHLDYQFTKGDPQPLDRRLFPAGAGPREVWTMRDTAAGTRPHRVRPQRHRQARAGGGRLVLARRGAPPLPASGDARLRHRRRLLLRRPPRPWRGRLRHPLAHAGRRDAGDHLNRPHRAPHPRRGRPHGRPRRDRAEHRRRRRRSPPPSPSGARPARSPPPAPAGRASASPSWWTTSSPASTAVTTRCSPSPPPTACCASSTPPRVHRHRPARGARAGARGSRAVSRLRVAVVGAGNIAQQHLPGAHAPPAVRGGAALRRRPRRARADEPDRFGIARGRRHRRRAAPRRRGRRLRPGQRPAPSSRWPAPASPPGCRP